MKRNFVICQTENRDYLFEPMKRALENGFSMSDYADVWQGEIEAETIGDALDELFRIFNMDIPEGYRGRSLSVSDVVKLDGTPYYCDVFGWSEIPSEAAS